MTTKPSDKSGTEIIEEALAGWIVTARANGAYIGHFADWIGPHLRGSPRTPAESTDLAIKAIAAYHELEAASRDIADFLWEASRHGTTTSESGSRLRAALAALDKAKAV